MMGFNKEKLNSKTQKIEELIYIQQFFLAFCQYYLSKINKMSSEKTLTSFQTTSEDQIQQVASLTKLSSGKFSERIKRQNLSKIELKKHLIKKFAKNLSQNNLRRQNFSKNFKNENAKVLNSNDFACPICLQVMINPVVFECGHFGCLKCIQTVSFYQNQCFLCRRTLRNTQYKQSTVIKQLINKKIQRNLQNPIQYYTRLADHINWEKNRRVNLKDIDIGSMVDIRCKETGKWKVGCVVQLKRDFSFQCYILIKYSLQDSHIEEIIGINSSRLAKLGFFTQKMLIELVSTQREEIESEIPQISNQNDGRIEHFSFDDLIPDQFYKLNSSKEGDAEEIKPQNTLLSNIDFQNNDADLQIDQMLNPKFMNCYSNEDLMQIML